MEAFDIQHKDDNVLSVLWLCYLFWKENIFDNSDLHNDLGYTV